MNNQKSYLIIIFFCLFQFIIHLIADYNSGFQGDELLHIEAGKHLAFGYLEFPPLIGWLAFIQNLFGSTSVFVHHFFSHLASVLIFIIVGLTTIELGGKAKAVFFVLLSMSVSPALARIYQLFQPVIFSNLFWMLSFYQLVRFIKTLDGKYLLYLSIILAFGFLTKYDIIFFGIGLLSLLLFKRTRNSILQKSTIARVLIFFTLISPNIIWQIQNNFPIWQHISELYISQLDNLTAINVLLEILIHLNPFTSIFWLSGLIFMFSNKNKELFRPVSIAILFSIACLTISKGKSYYFFPAIITLMIFGSIWIESKIEVKRKWLIYPITIILAFTGFAMIPHGISVYPFEDFLQSSRFKPNENNEYDIPFEEYYSYKMWTEVLSLTKSTYDNLPNSEQKDCLIWGKHYKQAGAVNLFRDQYQLPKAFFYHGSFYLWAPTGKMPATIIAIGNKGVGMAFWETYFDNVTEVKRYYNNYADEDEDKWQAIYVCREPKQDFAKLKKIFEFRIFE